MEVDFHIAWLLWEKINVCWCYFEKPQAGFRQSKDA